MIYHNSDVGPKGGSNVSRNRGASRLAEALGRVGEGDPDAFEEVYRHSATKLFGVCLLIVRRRSDAEDALQDVYCSVWRGAASFDDRRGSAMTWLITLARNHSVDRLRRLKPAIMAPIECASGAADPQPSAFELIETDQQYSEMRRCLDLLSARDANALRMAFFQGATYADLASAACIPLATMKSRIRQSLRKIRETMATSGLSSKTTNARRSRQI